MNTIIEPTQIKEPIWHSTENEGPYYTCPECGKVLESKGATGTTSVGGAYVEMDASWFECECGYTCPD